MSRPERSLLKRISITLVITVLAIVAVGTAISIYVKASISSRAPGASWSSFQVGYDALLITGLRVPEKSLLIDSAWVIIGGVFPSPEPVQLLLCGGSYDPRGQTESASETGDSSPLPPTVLQDVFLPDSSSLFISRLRHTDAIQVDGGWGKVTASRTGDDFTAVFTDLSSLPLGTEGLPPFLSGHSISGICSGSFGDTTAVSGRIIALDGQEASAAFSYIRSGENLKAEFTMDFAQIEAPALRILDSLTAGAVMADAPYGSLTVTLGSLDSIRFNADIHFDTVMVSSQSIAPDTVSFSTSLECTGWFTPEENHLEIDSGAIQLNEVPVYFNLRCSWGDRRRLDLCVYNHSLSGGDITASLPEELLGRLQGVTLHGEIDFYFDVCLDWNFPDSSDFNIDIDAARLYVGYSPVSFSRLMDPAAGSVCTMRDSWGNTSLIHLDTLQNDQFYPYDSIPYFFEPLLCCAEDASFRRHSGFSEYHIRNSIRADMEEGRFVRGGSTISMQLVKNLFLGREKTLARKLQEVFLTWRMERWLSKDRIIELYANIVELGPGVFGFNAAAQYYFDEQFSDLSVRETAFLVSILPGPKIYHRFAISGVLPGYWRNYVERLISICGSRGWLQNDLVSEALGDTLIFDGRVSSLRVDNDASQNY